MINTELIIYSSVLLCTVGIFAFTIIAGIAFYKTGQGGAKSFGLLFERGNFLRIITTVLIIQATILLSAIDKLQSEGAASILSGVAGYVLGGISKKNKKIEE